MAVLMEHSWAGPKVASMADLMAFLMAVQKADSKAGPMVAHSAVH